MKRITVSEVKEAYEKTGLTPTQEEYFCVNDAGDYCGCAAFAVACLRDPDFFERAKDWYAQEAREEMYGGQTDQNIEAELKEVFGSEYLAGLTSGFDDCIELTFDNAEGEQGYFDGMDAAAAIWDEKGNRIDA